MAIIRETYDATVTRIDGGDDDPERLGRIRVTCVGILGDELSELPMWIEPKFAWGAFVVPDIGEIVEIEVVTSSEQDEHFGQISIDNLDAKWTGKRSYTDAEIEAETEAVSQTVARPIPEDFTGMNYGKRRGFATPGGHILFFDDTDGSRRIQLTWKDENEKATTMEVDEAGSWKITTHNGESVHCDVDGVIAVAADKVHLGLRGVTEAVIKGTEFVGGYKVHTHPTPLGPSGPPLASDGAAADASLSTVVFTE